MQAAFVDIGLERNAFLYVDDVFLEWQEDTPPLNRNPIEKLLKVGEEIMVQVIKEPFGTKGARLTGQVTLPGRYLVLVPGADYVGVSDGSRARRRGPPAPGGDEHLPRRPRPHRPDRG